jgi:hypothetical protein
MVCVPKRQTPLIFSHVLINLITHAPPLTPTSQTIHERTGLPAPDQPMTQLRVQEFVLAHADMYTAVVLEKKRAGRKISFLDHLKHFLGLKSLLLPPRKVSKRVNPTFKQEFLGWLARERAVENAKTASQHYNSTLELARALHKRLHGSVGAPAAAAAAAAAVEDGVGVGGSGSGSIVSGQQQEEEDEEEEDEEEEDDDDDGDDGNDGDGADGDSSSSSKACLVSLDKAALRALVEACAHRGLLEDALRPLYEKNRRQATLLNHLSAYLDLPCLAPPRAPPRGNPNLRPAVDSGPLHPALKAAFCGWLQRGRCVSDKTAQQYAREVGRVVKRALEDDAALAAEEAAGRLVALGLLRASAAGGGGAAAAPAAAAPAAAAAAVVAEEQEGKEEEEEGEDGGGGEFDKAVVAGLVAAHLPALNGAAGSLQKKMRGWGTFKEFLGILDSSSEGGDGGAGASVVAASAAAAVAVVGEGEGGEEEKEEDEMEAPSVSGSTVGEGEGEGGRKGQRRRARGLGEAAEQEGPGMGGGKTRRVTMARRCIPSFLTPGLQGEYLAWLGGGDGGGGGGGVVVVEGEEERRAHLDVALKMTWKIYRVVHPNAPVPTSSSAVAGAPSAGDGGGGQGPVPPPSLPPPPAEAPAALATATQQQQQQQQKEKEQKEQKGLDRAGVAALLTGHERAVREVEGAYPSMRGAFAAFYRFATGLDRAVAAAVVLPEEKKEKRGEKARGVGSGSGSKGEGGGGGSMDEDEEEAWKEEGSMAGAIEELPPSGAAAEGQTLLVPVPNPPPPAIIARGVKRQPPPPPPPSGSASVVSVGAAGAGKRPRRRTPGERMAAMEVELAGLRRENDRLTDQLSVAQQQREEAARVAAAVRCVAVLCAVVCWLLVVGCWLAWGLEGGLGWDLSPQVDGGGG